MNADIDETRGFKNWLSIGSKFSKILADCNCAEEEPRECVAKSRGLKRVSMMGKQWVGV